LPICLGRRFFDGRGRADDRFPPDQGHADALLGERRSGKDITRSFCASCGTPIFSEPQGGAIWVVKAGTLDDPSWLKLGGNLYTKSAQPWSHIDPSLMQFEKMPNGSV